MFGASYFSLFSSLIIVSSLTVYYPSICSGSSEGRIGRSETTNIQVFTVLCWEAGQGLNHVSASIQDTNFNHPTYLLLYTEERVTVANSNSDQNHRPLFVAVSDDPHCEQWRGGFWWHCRLFYAQPRCNKWHKNIWGTSAVLCTVQQKVATFQVRQVPSVKFWTIYQVGVCEGELSGWSWRDGSRVQTLRHSSPLSPRLDSACGRRGVPRQWHCRHGWSLLVVGQIQALLDRGRHGNGSRGSSLWGWNGKSVHKYL